MGHLMSGLDSMAKDIFPHELVLVYRTMCTLTNKQYIWNGCAHLIDNMELTEVKKSCREISTSSAYTSPINCTIQ